MRMVDLAEIACAYVRCEVVFKPRRQTQKYHHIDCRRADYREHLHPCPLCGYHHQPDDLSVLDALELTLLTVLPGEERLRDEIRELIGRRRGIIDGNSSGQMIR